MTRSSGDCGAENNGGAYAEDERDTDSCYGYCQGLLARSANCTDVELETDQEQKEEQADVRESIQHRHASFGEDIVKELFASSQR